MSGALVEVALSAIVVDAAAQIRAGGTDPAVVADYADAMEQGAAFPPVVLFHDGGDHFAADGFIALPRPPRSAAPPSWLTCAAARHAMPSSMP